MQSTNSLFQNRKFLVLVGFVFVSLLVITLYIIFSKSNDTDFKTNEYFDSFSGETISDPEYRTTESYGGEVYNGIVFLGFTKLLDYGVSESQLLAIYNDLAGSELTTNVAIKEVSFNVSEVTINESSTIIDGVRFRDSISSRIMIGRDKIYNITVETSRLKRVSIVIKDSDKPVYSSGSITLDEVLAD